MVDVLIRSLVFALGA